MIKTGFLVVEGTFGVTEHALKRMQSSLTGKLWVFVVLLVC